MNSNIVTVGKKIRQIREAVGLSRPKFADLLGVPPTTLKNYELGYQEVGGVFLVALGIDADEYDVLNAKLAVFNLGNILELGSKAVYAPERDSVGEVHLPD